MLIQGRVGCLVVELKRTTLVRLEARIAPILREESLRSEIKTNYCLPVHSLKLSQIAARLPERGGASVAEKSAPDYALAIHNNFRVVKHIRALRLHHSGQLGLSLTSPCKSSAGLNQITMSKCRLATSTRPSAALVAVQ